MGKKIKHITKFLTRDIWFIKVKDLPAAKNYGITVLRIIVRSIKNFSLDNCMLHASALTYCTLLSIVPLMAMLFGIAKGFGLDTMLEKQLIEKFRGQEKILAFIMNFSEKLLKQTNGGIVAGIGVVLLLWTIFKLLTDIENAFNKIWGVKVSRPFGRKFIDYLAFLLICPLLIVLSGSLTVLLVTQVENFLTSHNFFGMLTPTIIALAKTLPVVALWIMFSFIYIFMPNTKVKFLNGVIAGIITGTLYQLGQWIFLTTQIGVSKYNAIYGSFAALPLFLIWLQFSWLLVLFGAEVCFVSQNLASYEFEPDVIHVSYRYKRLLTLFILTVIIKNFEKKKLPLSSVQIAEKFDIPVKLVRDILFECVQSNLLFEVSSLGLKEEKTYMLTTNSEYYTIAYVSDALEKYGVESLPIHETPEFRELKGLQEQIKKLSQELPPSRVKLKSLIEVTNL